MKTENKLMVKNPFRFYRYEVPGSYVRFGFSDGFVELRTDRDDAGWDDITRIIPLNSLSDINKIRLLPFLSEITEEEYMENSSIIDLQDCIITQEWAKDLSEEVKLLNIFNRDGENYMFPEKINEDIFTSIFISEKYHSILERPLTLNDVESFTIKFLFFHDYATDDLEFMVENIVFKNPEEIEKIIKDDDPYPNTLYIDSSVYDFYFGIRGSGSNMVNLLSQEYLITPAMVLDYELYDKIKSKIEYIKYETAGTY